MTEEERNKRGQKSAVIVERLVRVQLRAMSCERFDLGIRREAGEMILREGQGAIGRPYRRYHRANEGGRIRTGRGG